MILITILIFITGLFIGSFLNVVIDRVPRSESFIIGRSHCDVCQHPLAWYDLFPLISFLLLQGKCRYCHKKIGWQYPLVEFTTAVTFASNFLFFHNAQLLTIIFSFCILCISIIVFFTDLWSGIIPDVALGFGFVATVIVFLLQKESFIPHVVGFLLSGFFFWVLWFVTKQKGMGFGDVKLAAFLGFLLGTPFIIPAFYLAFLTGAIVALILIGARRKKLKGDTLPFGPFLIGGGLITFYVGNTLWQFFVKIIFHLS